MSLRKYLIIFFLSLSAVAAVIAGFNVAVDPFGVFGDRFLVYWSYDMTQNPRVAKIAFLDKNYKKYDSYIVGSSKTSSYSVKKLNEYTGASFYNMIMYGGDLYDAQKTAEYVIDHYNVKNLILNIGIEESVQYDQEDDPTKGNLHAKVDGGNEWLFMLKYAFLNPQYAFDKLTAYSRRGYLPTKDEVFIPETGVYNKAVRDVEDVNADRDFYIWREKRNDLMNADKAVASVAAVKKKCDEKGIDLKVIASPLFDTEIQDYNYEQLCSYWQKLAQVTDIYDFTGYSGISMDARYFYDDAHFRNCVGDMALAYIYGDDSVYIPESFGHITTAENAYEFARERFRRPEFAVDTNEYTASVPILMYHDISPEGDVNGGGMTITPEHFEADLDMLADNGYSTVSFDDLEKYVYKGIPLPEKPVLITFDDGYRSNYLYAYPALAARGMRATVFAVGVTTGKDTYKDTGKSITPHFTYAEAREMCESGVIDIESHTYDLHRVEALDGADYRNGASKLDSETDTEFAQLFRADISRSRTEIERNTGSRVIALSYPQGVHSVLTDACVKQSGFISTVTVNEAPNTVVMGIPQTLYNLNRIGVYPDTTSENLLERIIKNGG